MIHFLGILRTAALAFVAVCCLRGAADAPTATDTIFIGTAAVHEGKGIWRCQFDTVSGRLSPAKLSATIADSNFLAVSPNGRFLYAANGHENALVCFRIAQDGGLQEVNRQPSHAIGPCHIWASDTHLFSANYSGGSVTVCPINPDGSLSAPSAVAAFSGSGPYPRWQDRPYGHGVCADASGRHVYVCDRGSDRIWSFRLDAANGALQPTEPPAGRTPPGTGPRHAVISRDGRFLYANSEMGRDVSVFARDVQSGALTWLAAYPVLPDATVQGGWTAEVALHPSGRWLYVSVRGHNLLSLFAVNPDGTLSWRENAPAGVVMPRSFVLSPDGRWLIVGGVADNRLQVHRIDPATGRLSPWGEAVPVPAPYCVALRSADMPAASATAKAP